LLSHALSADDGYALTAYILKLNEVGPNDFVAGRDNLPKVKMPNREYFVWTDPRPDTNAKPCMRACVNPADIKVTSAAEGRNLTPHASGPHNTMPSL
jgi:cytochrome c